MRTQQSYPICMTISSSYMILLKKKSNVQNVQGRHYLNICWGLQLVSALAGIVIKNRLVSPEKTGSATLIKQLQIIPSPSRKICTLLLLKKRGNIYVKCRWRIQDFPGETTSLLFDRFFFLKTAENEILSERGGVRIP